MATTPKTLNTSAVSGIFSFLANAPAEIASLQAGGMPLLTILQSALPAADAAKLTAIETEVATVEKVFPFAQTAAQTLVPLAEAILSQLAQQSTQSAPAAVAAQ